MDRYTAPHRDGAALVTIDVQNDFCLPGAPAEIEGTMDVVPRIQRLLKAFREKDRPVIHVVRLYREDGSNVDICRRADVENGESVVTPGSMGAELIDELKPTNNTGLDADSLLNNGFQQIVSQEWVMYKPRWSAFYNTNLENFLDENSVDSIVVAGCNYPNCPRTTIYDASMRDYRVVFVPDATSKTYQRGLEELKNIGVSIKETDELINWIR